MTRLASLSHVRISVSRCVYWLRHRLSKWRAPIVSVTLFVVIQCAILLVVDLGSHSSYLVGRSSSEGGSCRWWRPERGVGDFSASWCCTFSHTKSGWVTAHQSFPWIFSHNLRLMEGVASRLSERRGILRNHCWRKWVCFKPFEVWDYSLVIDSWVSLVRKGISNWTLLADYSLDLLQSFSSCHAFVINCYA